MSLGTRFKDIRESTGKTQKEFADAIGKSLTAIQSYESDRQVPGGNVLTSLGLMGFDINWLLTGKGEMRRETPVKHVANGNNIIQDAHIDAEEVHLEVHAADPGLEYKDPVAKAFMADWLSLSDVKKMRIWTMVKEEIERGRGE